MKAIWNNTVIAEAPTQDLVDVDGVLYFPPESLSRAYFKPNYQQTQSTFGNMSYYDIIVEDKHNPTGASYYADPGEEGLHHVGKDFTGYVAFWNGVELVD